MKLKEDFYFQKDVIKVAKNLLGKILTTNFNGEITSGIILETEGYNGIIDKASHAYNNRRTARTEIMFGKGGVAYVYLCYGIHSLFNVVTNNENIPHAVLIRSLQPLDGIEIMEKRRKLLATNSNFSSGPGKLSKALGIHYSKSGTSLLGNEIWIEDRKIDIEEKKIKITPRIGVDYAGIDALLPYRFFIDKLNEPLLYKNS